jgi:putative aldouronate transport system substrate-binding protein
MKRYGIMAFILILCLSVILSGCGSTTQTGKDSGKTTGTSTAINTDSTTDSPSVTAAGEYPITKEQVTLRVFYNTDATLGDMSENDTTKWLEEKTNVKLEWILSGQNEAKEKLSIILASSTELPDIIMTANAAEIITADQIFAYGAQGLFIPLNEMIERYGVNVEKGFELFPGAKEQMTAPDGNIYALPRLQDCYHCTIPGKYWINQTWLDKLNMDMPSTPDELHSVLMAFKNNDPNGNNKKDEIPLSGRSNMWSTLDNFIMNAFQYSPGNAGENFYWMYIEDGKVIFAPTQEGWKQGLKFQKKLFDDDLVDKEIFINTKQQLLALTGDPNGNRVGSFQALHIGAGVDTGSKVVEEYQPVPPLNGPAGRIAPDQPTKYYPAYLITKACKYPEVAFRLGDTLMTHPLTDEITLEWMTLIYGPEGKGWERAKAGEVGLDGQPALYRDLLAGLTSQNFAWNQSGPTLFPDSLRNRMVADLNKWSNEKSLYDATKNVYEQYKVEKTLPYMNYTTDVTQQLAEIKVNIQKYVNESIAQFITGAMDIDADWDKYVKQLNDMGLQQLIDLTQQTYDNYLKNR